VPLLVVKAQLDCGTSRARQKASAAMTQCAAKNEKVLTRLLETARPPRFMCFPKKSFITGLFLVSPKIRFHKSNHLQAKKALKCSQK